MKNLFVVPVVALGLLFSTNAVAQDETISSDSEMVMQEDYIDVAVENLPQPVLDAVSKDFAGATVTAAGAKEDASEFKLTLAKEDGEVVEVYADAEGNWITK